jgi:hypothetical protein
VHRRLHGQRRLHKAKPAAVPRAGCRDTLFELGQSLHPAMDTCQPSICRVRTEAPRLRARPASAGAWRHAGPRVTMRSPPGPGYTLRHGHHSVVPAGDLQHRPADSSPGLPSWRLAPQKDSPARRPLARCAPACPSALVRPVSVASGCRAIDTTFAFVAL